MISKYFNLIILLVLALGSTSYATRCYECTEYDNRHNGQANTTDEHFVDFAKGEKSLNNLCRGFTGIYAALFLVDCDGDCTYAVVQSDENVYATYRACASTLSCTNFKPPIPGTNMTLCKTCSEDKCNLSEPKNSAVNNGVSAFFIFITFLVTYINVLS